MQISFQLKGSGAELSGRVQSLLTISRVHGNTSEYDGSVYLPGSTKIYDHTLASLQDVSWDQPERFIAWHFLLI